MIRALVLNVTYEPLSVVAGRRAAVLVLTERADIVHEGDEVLHSERLSLPVPSVVRLRSFVRVPFQRRAAISRRGVFVRDGGVCQYCGDRAESIDHVIPRSRGGESVWENIVTSCAPCNRRKGNRLPREIHMHPKTAPRPPGPNVFIRVAAPKPPPIWERYLAPAAAAA